MTVPSWRNGVVRSPDELRRWIEAPHEAIVRKTVDRIEDQVRRYVALTPIFYLATADAATGRADVSPRGDKPGFVRVLDEKHVAFPDRPGNRRTDSLINMIGNPQVGMIFIIPGCDEVLRINGRATVTHDEAFIAEQGWSGKTTGLAVVVETEEIFVHCPRALKQAGIWNTATWIPKEQHPSAMDIYHTHLRMNGYNW